MRKLLNFRPPVICGLCSVLGIIMAAVFTRISIIIVFLPIILGAITAAVVFIINKKVPVLVYAAVFILLYSICALRISVYVGNNYSATTTENQITFYGVVEDASYDSSTDSSSVLLKDISAEAFDAKGGKVLLYLKGECEIGDSFSVTANLKKTKFEEVETLNFPDGIFYKAYNVVKTEKVSSGSGFFYGARVGIKSILKKNLPEDSAAFITSLVLGDAGGLDEEFYSNLKAAGVAHIFAVSGLHIGFLAALISFLLNKINVRRMKNALLVLLITALYAGICGFSVSSIRAVVTCFIYGVARSFGFKRDNFNAVFISLVVVLFIYPSSLFSYGFLLSFSAVIGIACMRNNFVRLFSFMNEKVAGALAVSLSAFLATAPIIAILTKSVSLIAVLVNLLFLPIVSIIYYIAVVSVIVAAIIPGLGVIFNLTEVLSYFVIKVTGAVDFTRFLITGSLSVVNLIYYYTALILSCEKVNLPEKLKRAIGASASISLILFI